MLPAVMQDLPQQVRIMSKAKPGWVCIISSLAPSILAAIPEAIVVGADPRGPIMEVPFTQDNAEKLAELRAPHAPPMVDAYDWKASFEPFQHQYRIGGALSVHRRFFCLADAGTGKTVSVVWAFDYLKTIERAKKLLIIAPLSLLEDTWAKEFRNAAPHLKAVVLHGSADKRRALIKQPHDVAIINYDGVEIVHDDLKDAGYDVIALDESTAIKNVNRRWRFVRSLTIDVPWLWLLTATPSTQSPMDAFGQCRMMHGDKFPYTEGGWKNATMRQVTEFKWVPRPEAADLINQWMQPAIYIKKRDVLAELPPVMRSRRKVGITPEQARMFKDLRKTAMAVATNGEQISAVHAAALNVKILQIASGCVYDDHKNVAEIDNQPRINELIEVVQQTRQLEDLTDPKPNNKVLVFCMFKHTVAAVVAALKAKGIDAESVTGDTSSGRRNTIFATFQDTRKIDVLVAIPDVAAHGLTLTAASTTVWFTPVASAEKFVQACNRTDRPGQKYPMQIVEFYGTDAEKVMYDRLDEREQHQKDVLSDYAELVSFL